MYTLFSTQLNSLSDFFKTLNREEIKNCCAPVVYSRGKEYFKDESVVSAVYNNNQTNLKTTVEGTSKYTVNISLLNKKIQGTCTCPFDGVCKHMVASLLFGIKENSEIETSFDVKKSGNEILQYLNALSKDDLVSLIVKYAPEQYFTEIKNKFSNSDTAKALFKKISQKIYKIFKNDESLYDPDDFSAILDNEILKLSGLEMQLKDEIKGLIFHIIEKIDEAFDEGYLYDHYEDNNYEPSEEFISFIVNYVSCLDLEEKTSFILELDEVLNNESYTTFECLSDLSLKVYSEKDLPSLKDLLIRDYETFSPQLIENYYEKTCQLLSIREKELILIEIQDFDHKWLIELANLYKSQNELNKAISVVKNWLARNKNQYGDEDIYIFYLDLLALAKTELYQIAKEAIAKCPTSTMLQKISSLGTGQLSEYESILAQRNEGEMLDYLECNKRHSEALNLIKHGKNIQTSQLNKFFKKHKRLFPAEAEEYFTKIINNNLQIAGDSYYQAIADAMHELIKINPGLAHTYLNEIRFNYKRRRNLISILSKF